MTERRRHREPLITVIVPVYNEVATIIELLRRVLNAPYAKQVIVVDDASNDGTAEELAAWSERSRVQVLSHPKNLGKGSAIRTALKHATGRVTVIQDADLEYDPRDYAPLIAPIIDGRADVVYGSRQLSSGASRRAGRQLFQAGVSVLNAAVRVLYGVRLTDQATCYKAFDTTLLRSLNLECSRFEFCAEVTAKICRLHVSIQEVWIRYEPRGKEAGKKIRLRDGIIALYMLWKLRNWNPTAPL